MAHFMVPMMSYLRVNGLKTHLNHMMNMHWVLLMKLKMAYFSDQHWESDGEVLGSEEGVVLDTGEVLGSTLGAADNVKIGLDNGSELGSLVGSLEVSNVGIPKGLLFGDKIEEARCGA